METVRRKTIQVSLVRIPPQLKELISRIPENSSFSERHGRLISLVNTNIEEDMIKVLFQFFDPLHHCFTFLDYQLVPTLEEFSRLLKIPILDQLPYNGTEKEPKLEEIAKALHLQSSDLKGHWEVRSGIKGFLARFLFEKAQECWNSLDLQAFEEVVALLVYGLVLFPNPDQLIDISAVQIFMSRNPIPTLLGDILHSCYTRTMRKRGVLMCCTPLLGRWFISHLPQSVLKNERGLRWSQRLMTLTHADIHWCPRSREDVTIIDRCGEYPNVPLLGIRGGITYSPCLAWRQFGYARRDGPHDMLIPDIVFDFDNDTQGLRQRFIRAWRMPSRIDSKTLGHRNSIPLEPYLKWVRARSQKLVMPYPHMLPVIKEPVLEGEVSHIIQHPDMPTSWEEMQKSWIQLKEERNSLETSLHASEKKVLELTRLLHEERNLNTYIAPKRMRNVFLP